MAPSKVQYANQFLIRVKLVCHWLANSFPLLAVRNASSTGGAAAEVVESGASVAQQLVLVGILWYSYVLGTGRIEVDLRG